MATTRPYQRARIRTNDDFVPGGCIFGFVLLWIVGVLLSLATSIGVIWLIVVAIQYLSSH